MKVNFIVQNLRNLLLFGAGVSGVGVDSGRSLLRHSGVNSGLDSGSFVGRKFVCKYGRSSQVSSSSSSSVMGVVANICPETVIFCSVKAIADRKLCPSGYVARISRRQNTGHIPGKKVRLISEYGTCFRNYLWA